MADEEQYPATDTPQFDDSPPPRDDPHGTETDQPGTPPPAGAPTSPGLAKPADAPRPSLAAQQAAPARQSTVSIMSTITMSVATAGLIMGGYALYRAFAPPRPPGEVTSGEMGDMVKKEDLKKATDRMDQIATDLDQAKKQIEARPDYAPQLKMQADRLNELSQSVSQMTPMFDSVNQKLDTLGKVQGTTAPGRIDAMDKQVEEMARALDALRANVASIQRAGGGGGASTNAEAALEMQAMDSAVELFKAQKYTEARDAFVKLQASTPNDARVWYLAAIANGFATGVWVGETERMVNTGLDHEKAGQPSSGRIDSTLAFLTPNTGKAWLADYRKRINPPR